MDVRIFEYLSLWFWLSYLYFDHNFSSMNQGWLALYHLVKKTVAVAASQSYILSKHVSFSRHFQYGSLPLKNANMYIYIPDTHIDRALSITIIIIMIKVNIYYSPVSARRRSWRRPFIITLSLSRNHQNHFAFY